MRTTDIPGFSKLSPPEKILLVEEIWDTVVADESAIPVPDSHRRELDRRVSRYRSSPGKLLTLEELQQRLQQCPSSSGSFHRPRATCESAELGTRSAHRGWAMPSSMSSSRPSTTSSSTLCSTGLNRVTSGVDF